MKAAIVLAFLFLVVVLTFSGCATVDKVQPPEVVSPTDAELRCVEFGGTFISGPITPSHVCVLELTGPSTSGQMVIPEGERD